MPKHEFWWMLDEQTRVGAFFLNDAKNVVRFVVKLEYLLDGKWMEVSRYDAFHGYVHRDMLNKRGQKTRTVKLESSLRGLGMNTAINDFKTNFKSYVRRWLDE